VKYENYRGTQIINSGAWQAQTDYQRRVGLVPTPGILTALNLRTLQVRLINFIEPDSGKPQELGQQIPA
jgi:DNA polymerase II small subunit